VFNHLTASASFSQAPHLLLQIALPALKSRHTDITSSATVSAAPETEWCCDNLSLKLLEGGPEAR
jgi:hypothetical protein